jgi:hypothetical protein
LPGSVGAFRFKGQLDRKLHQSLSMRKRKDARAAVTAPQTEVRGRRVLIRGVRFCRRAEEMARIFISHASKDAGAAQRLLEWIGCIPRFRRRLPTLAIRGFITPETTLPYNSNHLADGTASVRLFDLAPSPWGG